MFHITPQIVASDIRRSAEFYTRHFAFFVTQVDPPEDPEFIALEREESSLFLVSSASRTEARRDMLQTQQWGIGVRLYFEVDDAAALYKQLREAGVPILRDLAVNEEENYTEFLISDPDGYEIGVYS
ncbi:MAG: VOC family protein [Chthonomonadales bacterium]